MFSRTFAPFLFAAALLSAGCSSSGGDAQKPGAQGCVSTRTYFAHDVWASFMGTQCFKCHSPDGVAVAQQNAKFVLQPSSYPAFLDANLANVKETAKIEYEGTSELLLKPLGKMNHGGGAVLTEGSAQYAALMELLARLQKPDACEEPLSGATLEGVTELDPQATFRKAALHLAGRLPTSAENQSLAQGGEQALDQALTALLSEPRFYDRLQELFNDVLLTDKYAWASYPVALYQLNREDYPGVAALRAEWDKPNHGEWGTWTDDQRRHMNDVLGREPLNLVRYVVENDLPFTEILTANYAVVDDALARVYGVNDGKTGVRKAQVMIGSAQQIAIPHAGLLSTPMFLNRWPTTPTNRSRGRARLLLKTFLATDILKIADRPVDVATVTAKDNPTMNAEQCVVCHRIIDPIAGGFRGWDESDYERFKPDRPWHDDMFHPGFGGEDLPPADYGSAIQWLAQQMAADPRFDLSAAQLVFKMVTGRAVLAYPLASEPDFEPKLRAWEAQDAFLRAAVQTYVAGGRNVKLLFKAVVMSPYYRAIRITGASAEHLLDADAFGTARLLSPEMLNRKIIATTGIHWRMQWDWKNDHDWLLDGGTQLLYGGIDSDSVTERATALNGVMSNLAWRMANEVACNAAAYDFSLDQDKRALFPFVRLVEVPESAGYAVPGAQAKMKQNIQYLHERLLGERLPDGDPEIEKTFQLFLDTWREGQQGAKAQGLNWQCSLNPTDGSTLPDELRRDQDFVVRSWMAVVTYLLSDERFLYE